MNTDEYLAIEGNALIEGATETLLRQVHPTQLDANDNPTSPAFEPTEAHKFLLSTKREAFGVLDACDAHRTRGLETAGTWGVKVADAIAAGTPAIDDAAHLGEPGHASLSFLDHSSRGKRTQSARKLRDGAICLHRHDHFGHVVEVDDTQHTAPSPGANEVEGQLQPAPDTESTKPQPD